MEWNAQRLEETLALLRERGFDSTEIEVKAARGGLPENLGQTLSAFANMPDGGTLILGVDEKSGFTPVGVDAEVEAGIASLARNGVVPSPHLDFYPFTFKSDNNPLTVLVVAVRGLSIVDRPARYKGQAYLRQSDGDYRMNDAEQRMVEVAKLHAEEQVLYDEAPVAHTSIDDLDPTYLETYLSNVRAESRRLAGFAPEKILRAKGLLTAEGQLTLAGLYALGSYPQGVRPALTVTAAVQLPEGSGARTRNRRDFDGPLPDLLNDLVAWCAQNLPREQRYRQDGHMVDVPLVPLQAVREFVANALVHRDLGPGTLGQGKSVQIRVTPKALFIESPGGLRGLSVEQLKALEHAQAAVNQRLYDAAKYLRTPGGERLIEGEGGGIQEGFAAMAQAGLRPPQLINSGVKFKVILWFDRAEPVAQVPPEPVEIALVVPQVVESQVKLRKNSPYIVDALRRDGELSAPELAEQLGLSLAQVRYALRPLLESRYVVMVGGQGSHSTVYALNERD